MVFSLFRLHPTPSPTVLFELAESLIVGPAGFPGGVSVSVDGECFPETAKLLGGWQDDLF